MTLPRSARVAVGALTGALVILTGTGGVAAAAPQPTPPPTPQSSVPTTTATPVPTPTTSAPAPTATTAAPSTPAGTAQTSAPALAPAAPTAAPPTKFAGYPRYFRPTNKRGDKDGDVYHIKHVREIQYRLRWAKVYTGPITGYFGPLTEAAVKRFQQKIGKRVTGVVDLTTWQYLIWTTVQNPKAIPATCKKPGWHTCYDRATHQLFGFNNGYLWNVWLVRGGAKTAQTDPGSFKVFARYPKKNSTIYGTLMLWFQKFNGAEGVHGSITMVDPFVGHSHGCVNMYIADSKVLWDMTANRTHYVTVYGAWA